MKTVKVDSYIIEKLSINRGSKSKDSFSNLTANKKTVANSFVLKNRAAINLNLIFDKETIDNKQVSLFSFLNNRIKTELLVIVSKANNLLSSNNKWLKTRCPVSFSLRLDQSYPVALFLFNVFKISTCYEK